jgi:hypothetical protein
MSSMGLRPLPFVTNMASLGGEVGFRPRRRYPWGKPHRGLQGWSILHPLVGCGGSERGPRAAPSGGRVAEASFPD